jgi:hypothetical protein
MIRLMKTHHANVYELRVLSIDGGKTWTYLVDPLVPGQDHQTRWGDRAVLRPERAKNVHIISSHGTHWTGRVLINLHL